MTQTAQIDPSRIREHGGSNMTDKPYIGTATYSPEDNKLRLYPLHRLAQSDYERVKAYGFKWAPMQQLFVAPAWGPDREDLLIELCGEIEDEDKSLVDRAEERAERFEDYSEKRAKDADCAHKAVSAIADNIPLGQPILVGHHSERRARKDAERIENGMRRAVKMWETSKYWESRAAGALSMAKYKERPDVRSRRIKGLEADLRRMEKSTNRAADFSKAWQSVTTLEQALQIANFDHISKCFTLAEFPRNPPASQYEGMTSLWSALDGGVITHEQAREIALRVHARSNDHRARWITHLNNRLVYERAMLGETGYQELPKSPTRAILPLLNYAGTLTWKNPYHRGENETGEAKPITKAALAKVPNDYKGTRISADGTHRIRIVMGAYLGFTGEDWNKRHAYYPVVVTDAKQHPRPGSGTEDKEQQEIDIRVSRAQEAIQAASERRSKVLANNRAIVAAHRNGAPKPAPGPQEESFQLMAQTLKAGVQVVSADQLFPTPPTLAARMVALADVQPGQRVLEPSAGTGALLGALAQVGADDVLAIEINPKLASRLDATKAGVRCADFLQCNGDAGAFDRIVMNPPFKDAIDIRHIEHALGMLKPSGRLVAICANGPKQQERLRPLATSWEVLPSDTFAGTSVNAALFVIDKGAA